MPLPEFLDQTLVDGARKYGMMSPEDIRGIILRYWEPGFDGYTKKPGAAGNIPLEIRPEYWSLLANSLGYDMANPEWKSANMRPVVVEFTVEPSQGTRGAGLSDFDIVSSTNDPKINEAVVYGLSRWVYYNDTGRPVKGRITYRFDR